LSATPDAAHSSARAGDCLHGGSAMTDLLFVLGAIIFFGLSWAYAAGAERL
jgi:hypothetical protein